MRATSVFLLLALVAVAATATSAQEDVGMDLSMLDIYQSMPVDLPTRPAAEFAALHHAAGEEADAAIREAQRALPSYGGAHLLDMEALEDESSLLEAGAAVGALNGLRSKWDASVPDIVLKTAAPVDEMIHQLEIVDQLESHRPELTASAQMAAAFPRGPSVLGEEAAPSSFVQTQSHSQIQNQNQAQQQFQVQAQQGQGQAQQMQASMYTNAQGQQMLVVATEARSVSEAAVDHSAEAEAEAETEAETDADADADADSTTLTDAEAAAGVVTMSELKQMMELQGMSSQEIDAYMASLGESEVEVSVDAEAETEGEAEAETETEADAESRAAADADAVAEAEAEALLNSQTDAEFETEAGSGSESHAEGEAEAEGEVAMGAEAEQALAAQAEQDAVMEAEQYSQLETETEAEAETETEADAETESSAEAESEAESESESSVSDDEVVPLHSRAAPEHLAEFAPSTPTPMHSPAFERMHPALRKIAPAQSGYGVLPAFIQTGSESHSTAHAQAHARAHARAQAQAHAQAQAQAYAHAQQEESDAQFNPSAVQLGPSHDAYGYQPMTGSEFLQAQNIQPSLAQVSMQYGSPRAAAWLPPAPLAEQQVPLYVVGPGGLQPNLRAGPYAGQYGVGSNGQAVQQGPRYAEY